MEANSRSLHPRFVATLSRFDRDDRDRGVRSAAKAAPPQSPSLEAKVRDPAAKLDGRRIVEVRYAARRYCCGLVVVVVVLVVELCGGAGAGVVVVVVLSVSCFTF